MAGSKEDAETVSAFFQDMRVRGLGDPLLVVSDSATGITTLAGHWRKGGRSRQGDGTGGIRQA
jgi:transposase-like protein